MAKEMKKLRRKGLEDWKLVRKVCRNRLLQERYRTMKSRLAKMGEIEAFRMVKPLEGRSAIPPMQTPEGRTVFEFEKVSDMTAEQLEPGEEKDVVDERIEISVTMEDLKAAIKASPSNTAGGIGKMSYPLLRFWMRKEGDKMLALVNEWVKGDCRDWHKVETILIRKGNKSRYDVVKSWRMINLVSVMAKVVERVILRRITEHVELEDTQYGSRKNRSTHDAFKQMLEFIEYSKGMKVGIVTMDVEGGFDKVAIDFLSTVLYQRGCPENLKKWTMRWACRRSTRLRFHGKTSKVYYLNKGVPQGSPLSPFLFGAYVADVFRPRIQTRMNFRRMVSSYVDDGGILVATPTVEGTKEELAACLRECVEVAESRGMGFSSSEMDWIGFSEEDWGE